MNAAVATPLEPIAVGNCPTCNAFPVQHITEAAGDSYRFIRAKRKAATSRFVDNGDGTITDTNSGLMWSKATLCTSEVNHEQAGNLCVGLDLAGHTDWRLPTIEELFLLADRSKVRPAIDTEAFPDTKSDWYWTSTEHASGSSYAWFVYFNGGSADYCHRGGNDAFVRAVRSVPAGQ